MGLTVCGFPSSSCLSDSACLGLSGLNLTQGEGYGCCRAGTPVGAGPECCGGGGDGLVECRG